MKHNIFLLLASILTFVPGIYAQHGTIHEGLILQSEIMGKNVEYAVYLPPDYHTSNRSYPVVYLLHGYTDDETGWVQFGEVNRIVDAGIANGDIAPMVIVMPDGGVTWYINDHSGNVPWSDMFVQEFIPHVEKQYRIRATRRYRAIAGLSMGGYGSLVHSLKYPDLFSRCAAFSSAIRTEEDILAMTSDDYGWRHFNEVYGPRAEGDPVTDHWKQWSVLDMARKLPREQVEQVGFYIDCGDDDYLSPGSALLHIIFSERNIFHEYRVRDGEHNWTYWRTGLTDGLGFISDGFRQK